MLAGLRWLHGGISATELIQNTSDWDLWRAVNTISIQQDRWWWWYGVTHIHTHSNNTTYPEVIRGFWLDTRHFVSEDLLICSLVILNFTNLWDRSWQCFPTSIFSLVVDLKQQPNPMLHLIEYSRNHGNQMATALAYQIRWLAEKFSSFCLKENTMHN